MAGDIAAGALAFGLDPGLESAVPSGLHAATAADGVRADPRP